MKKIDFKEDHPFKIFCTWRFKDSVRQQEVFKRNLQRTRQDKLDSFNLQDADIIQTKQNKNNSKKKSKAGGDDASSDEEESRVFTNEELYELETSNLLVASWITNLGYQEKPYEDKFLFFNSEVLLN